MFDPSTTTCFLFMWYLSQANIHTLVADHSPRMLPNRTQRTLRVVQNETTAEVVDLLQQLIRNACVNDGTPTSGHESRSVDALTQFFRRGGFDFETFEAVPGRSNIVLPIEGSDPTAPAL